MMFISKIWRRISDRYKIKLLAIIEKWKLGENSRLSNKIMQTKITKTNLWVCRNK